MLRDNSTLRVLEKKSDDMKTLQVPRLTTSRTGCRFGVCNPPTQSSASEAIDL